MKTICKAFADLATCGRRQQITSMHQVEAERCRIGKDDFFLLSQNKQKFFRIKALENDGFFDNLAGEG